MIYSRRHVGGFGASGHNKSISIEVGSNRVFMFFFVWVHLCLLWHASTLHLPLNINQQQDLETMQGAS
jgi:hypothetical protein